MTPEQFRHDLPARMRALGISAIALGKLTGLSRTQSFEVANGNRTPHANNIEIVDRFLAKCEELAQKVHPIPIDWNRVETIRDIFTSIRMGYLEIKIVDRAPHQEIDLGALAGEPKKIEEIVAPLSHTLAGQQ